MSAKVHRGEEIPLRGRTGDLLASLAVNRGRSIARQTLASRIWSDVPWESSRPRLNTTLYRLRSQLEADSREPQYIVSSSPQDLMFASTKQCWVDIEAFEAAATAAISSPELTELMMTKIEPAIDLYSGELCPSATGIWLIEQRARMANLAVAARTRLAEEWMGRGEFARALTHARRGLRADPFREDLHRIAIRCQAARGDRAGALRHFEDLKTMLADELDASPMPETVRIIIDLAQGRPAAPPEAVNAAAVLEALNQAHASLAAVAESIDAAARQIGRLLDNP